MPGSLRNLVLGAVVATAIAGCGSDEGTIPADDSETLLARLQAIDENVARGQCPEAEAQAEEFATNVRELPGEVDGELRRGLEQSAEQLVSLTSSECEPDDGASGPQGPVTTETEPTTTTEVPTTTTTEETTTEETTTEEEEPTEEESPEPQTDEPQQDQDLVPNPGQGVGPGGGIGPGGGVGGGPG